MPGQPGGEESLAPRPESSDPARAPRPPSLTFRDPALRNLALGLLLASPIVVLIFSSFLPLSVDWYRLFAFVGRSPLAPHRMPIFFNPPWFALPLSLFAWLPLKLGQAINAYLNLAVAALVVVRYGGNRWSLILTLTSLPFATLLIYGNVEWIPMAAFLLPPDWGLPWLVTKPQSGVLAALVWFKRAPNRIRFLLPLAGFLGASLLVWPGWPRLALTNITQSTPTPFAGDSNASPWPWLIPLGVALLYYAWKREDELLAVWSTLCLSPYYVIHSATLFFSLVAGRSRRWALAAWLVLWATAIGLNWRLLFP